VLHAGAENAPGGSLVRDASLLHQLSRGESVMHWIDPAYCDIRLGFEVTAYAYVR